MATETLRPDATGAECNLEGEVGLDCPNHFANVDEVIWDSGATVNYTLSETYLIDLYNIEDSGVGVGTINHVTVYARCAAGETPTQASLKICIRSNSTVTKDVEQTLVAGYAIYSKQWVNNPADSQPWSWADIDALQIGVEERRCSATPESSTVSQMWAVIDYTEAAVGRSFGFIIG